LIRLVGAAASNDRVVLGLVPSNALLAKWTIVFQFEWRWGQLKAMTSFLSLIFFSRGWICKSNRMQTADFE
jgi:hypothetical protein